MTIPRQASLTFDDLCRADLEAVYRQDKEEVLRDHAFRILLLRTDTVEKLERLAFAGERGLEGWTTKELIEITNHFRLLSSPENEIRLYRECRDEAFRSAPRVRDFYVLALNKAGRPAEAIGEGSRIVAEGGHNALVWATLGESYTARMLFAEQLFHALREAKGDVAAIDKRLIDRFPGYFPSVDPADMTVALARSLQQKNLRTATRIFRRGFRESGSSFPGLGWMLRTIDWLRDLVVERGRLQRKKRTTGLNRGEIVLARLADDEAKAVERELECQAILVGIALELQGGSESLDYWTHAGILLLTLIKGADLPAIRTVLAHLFAVADADFKFATTASELQRIRNNYRAMLDATAANESDTELIQLRIQGVDFALAELHEGRSRFLAAGGCRGGALNEEYRRSVEGDPADTVNVFLRKTINFRALTSNLIPLHISGGIGCVGARMPDLLMNRQAQEDLADIVETKILQPLAPEERENPRAVIARIQQVVGAGLKLGDLQDLQSPAHRAFEIRSDGLIALSGVDEHMRKNTRTATELTAALLMQNGDCRETMYLNGSLFACWQQMQVKKLIAKAMLCLELDFHEGFETIVREEIPDIMRYQLRGGQFILYADSIAMCAKYQCERLDADDPTAVLRIFGIDELKAGLPLTRYELENAKIGVTYADGSTAWIEPKDPATGTWRPMDHKPAPGGGVPVIDNAGEHYENIRSLKLLNLVEEHSLTFLYDEREKTMAFCDGFYNDALFESPYAFGSGPVAMEEIHAGAGLIRAGSRVAKHPDGSVHRCPVYLEFLPFSQTEYEYALVEGDIPGTIQLMGRTFRGDLKRERRRLEEGTSPIPDLLKKIQDWKLERHETAAPDRTATEQQLARLMLEVARHQPDLVDIREVKAGEPLITENAVNTDVYLVLSGQLQVCRHGRPLLDDAGAPVLIMAGGIAGEISALTGGLASATVIGDGVVLAVAMSVIREQLQSDPAFRRRMEEMAGYRIY